MKEYRKNTNNNFRLGYLHFSTKMGDIMFALRAHYILNLKIYGKL